MADLQPYCFEPECVPNPEDSESENEEVSNGERTKFVHTVKSACA